jgi:glycosyltransferase involved in cell wall biosynthesis
VTITFVLPFVNLTGGIRVMLDYANWLHDRGHHITVVYPCWPYRFQYTRKQQWGEFQKHRRAGGTVPWYDVRCDVQCVPWIHHRFLPSADVVIATAWPTVRDVARLPRRCGTKVHIVMHHESQTGPESRIESIYRFDFFRIAFSRATASSIQERFGCRIDVVVPNGINPAIFFRDGDCRDASVLFLYHPDPRKGAADGLEALSRLRERLPRVSTRTVGTVKPPTWPETLPFEFHPADAILRRAYSTSAVLLYPSRYEGFGLPPLEAMACGCPPVTTCVGAVPEYATHGLNAFIVDPGDVEGMVDWLARALTDVPLRTRLAAEGLRTAGRYSLDAVAPAFAAALGQAAQSR